MGMISNVLYPNCRKSYSVYHRIQQYHSSCWCYCHRATYFVFHSTRSELRAIVNARSTEQIVSHLFGISTVNILFLADIVL